MLSNMGKCGLNTSEEKTQASDEFLSYSILSKYQQNVYSKPNCILIKFPQA